MIRRLVAYATGALSSRRLLLGLFLLSGIALAMFLHIRHNNSDTTFQVPEGSDMEITKDGRVDVKLPDDVAQGKQNSARPCRPTKRRSRERGRSSHRRSSCAGSRLARMAARSARSADTVHRTTRVVISGDTLKLLGEHVVGEAFQYKLNPAANRR